MTEITYNDVAKILECSPRQARRILIANKVKPIRLGHRTVRFPIDRIVKLKLSLRQHAIALTRRAR